MLLILRQCFQLVGRLWVGQFKTGQANVEEKVGEQGSHQEGQRCS